MNALKNSMYHGLSVVLFFFGTVLFSVPQEIIFVRHGEKLDDEHYINLSQRGYIRSYALIPLFVNLPLAKGGALPKDVIYKNGQPLLPALYGEPVALYAKAQKKADSAVRCIMTLEPIAQKLSLSVIHDPFECSNYDKKDPKKYQHCYIPLLEEILNNPAYDGNIVLIAWEHGAIPTMMQALLTICSEGVELHDDLSNPKLFKKFDRIIRCVLKKGMVKKVYNDAQELLYGDSSSSTTEVYTIKGKKMIKVKHD